MHALVVIALLAAAPTPNSPQDTLKLGEAYANRGDAKKAIKELDKVLATDGLTDDEKARAEAAYGLALVQSQKHADAATHLEKAVALKAVGEKNWLLLGMAYDGAGDGQSAVKAYRRGIEKLPKSATLHHELGMSLLGAGAAHEAVDVLQKAGALMPGDPEIKTDLSYALVVDGRYADAKEQANLALSLGRENADAYYNLGNAEAGLGKADLAKKAFQRAVDIDELHVPALLHLGLLLQKLGDDKGAMQRFLRVLQVEPEHPRARAALGTTLARLGTDDAKAKALLEQTVKVDPKYAPGQVGLGDIATRAGDLDLAVKHYEAAKKLLPDATTPEGKAIAERLESAKKARKDQKK